MEGWEDKQFWITNKPLNNDMKWKISFFGKNFYAEWKFVVKQFMEKNGVLATFLVCLYVQKEKKWKYIWLTYGMTK